MDLICNQKKKKKKKQWKYCWYLDIFIIFALLKWTFMFHSYFERKNDKVLPLNIVHFPNFEISAFKISVSKFNLAT